MGTCSPCVRNFLLFKRVCLCVVVCVYWIEGFAPKQTHTTHIAHRMACARWRGISYRIEKVFDYKTTPTVCSGATRANSCVCAPQQAQPGSLCGREKASVQPCVSVCVRVCVFVHSWEDPEWIKADDTPGRVLLREPAVRSGIWDQRSAASVFPPLGSPWGLSQQVST